MDVVPMEWGPAQRAIFVPVDYGARGTARAHLWRSARAAHRSAVQDEVGVGEVVGTMPMLPLAQAIIRGGSTYFAHDVTSVLPFLETRTGGGTRWQATHSLCVRRESFFLKKKKKKRFGG